MTTPLLFGDVEVALLELLAPYGYVVTSTPIDLAQRLPVVRVRRIGGPRDQMQDFPRVSIEVFQTGRDATRDVAEQVCDFLIDDVRVAAGVVLDKAEVLDGPHEVPYTDPEIRLYTMTINFTTRRR